MPDFSILVVDDDKDFLNGIIRNLEKKFSTYQIFKSQSGEKAVDILKTKHIGVMLSDLRMPVMSGMDLLQKALEINPYICVVMITGFATVENAVKALKVGAWDFITKPVEREPLFHAVTKATGHYTLVSENLRLQKLVKGLGDTKLSNCISKPMKLLREKVAAIASTNYTVLVTGESGSGKEYVARAIHEMSDRKNNPCQSLNCPSVPDQLLESELFGHTKGAFTGADRDRKGFFLSADNSTLILDEIGEITPAIQVKLLKFLQDKEVKPVGSSTSFKADVRIVALTNQDLEKKIADKAFREDLFYRLNVLSITVPPLRERKEDIPILVKQFISHTCHEMDIPRIEIDYAAVNYMTLQTWPGNVRELLNFIRRLVVFSNGKTIDMKLINVVQDEKLLSYTKQPGDVTKYKDAKKEVLDSFSKEYINNILTRTGGNVTEASRLSGLERASIQKILNRLDIDVNAFRNRKQRFSKSV